MGPHCSSANPEKLAQVSQRHIFNESLMELTWNNSWVLILLHVGLFASMSERMLIVFTDSIIEFHLQTNDIVNVNFLSAFKLIA